jgi:ubiquinone/menaquinone biosynthesis C-methylase UbiE
MDKNQLLAHDAYDRVEARFNDTLDESLHPHGPEILYDLVAQMRLPAGAVTLDVGCGRGRHTIDLAKRFRLSVRGIDPTPRHLEIAAEHLAEEARHDSALNDSVSFDLGSVEALPVADASVDLVWCRDVLCLIEDLDAAYADIRRVLKPTGKALVYQMFSTERLEPAEEAWLLPTMGCTSTSMRPEVAEAAIAAAGLQVDSCIVLGTEWGEYVQETTGHGGRKLLHAARLLRDPDRYIGAYGQAKYDIALGDCLWHVYRLIGKLSGRVYLLSPRHS